MKSLLRLSFAIIAFSFVSFVNANIQPTWNNNNLSITSILPHGGWGNQSERTVIIGATEGFTQVSILKDGELIDTFSFNAPAEYKYIASTTWTGEYVFIIENQNSSTRFVANF